MNDFASTLGELMLEPADVHSIYHVENPQRQSWCEMIAIFAELLDIPKENIIPFTEWLHRIRNSPSVPVSENPAARIGDFFEVDFERMGCGGLVMDTKHSVGHSRTLRGLRSLSKDIVTKYVRKWQDTKFLR